MYGALDISNALDLRAPSTPCSHQLIGDEQSGIRLIMSLTGITSDRRDLKALELI